MNLGELQAELRHFAAEREWQPFHTPKNLAMALMVETAELAEIFQWQTPEQSRGVPEQPELRQRVGEELADVLLYLLQLADHCQVDLPLAVRDKLAKNAQKYPAKQRIARTLAPQVAAAGAHVLLDFENVQPTDAELRALVPQASQVWVFHGPHQRQVAKRFASFGQHATAVPISQTGKNALDFHLSFYMGYIASRNPEAPMIVVANDKGYEPMLAHAQAMGFVVRRQPFPAAPAVAGPVAAKKAAARKGSAAPAAATKTAAKTAAKTTAKKATAKKATAKKTTATRTPAVKAPTAAPAPAPAPVSATAKRSVAKTAAPAKTARKAQAPAPTPKPSRPAPAIAKKTASAPRAVAATAVSAKDLQRITEQLLKSGAKRPTRLGRLQGLLKSLLSAQTGDAVIEVAIDALVAAGTVAVGPDGGVRYPRFEAGAAAGG